MSGVALDPIENSLYLQAHLSRDFVHDFRADIRDPSSVASAVREISPDVVIHMAAQSLVRDSYRNPRDTFETNVTGTLNVLEATRLVSGVRALLVVTTDKVYRNVGRRQDFVETDPLGGRDPYSASKAMADLMTQSWAASVSGVPTAIARAGNVIGGGDVSRERLIPDLINAFESRDSALIRHPDAVRPWQHVLDCLAGYLRIVEALLSGNGHGAWNIGPDPQQRLTVADVATLMATRWGIDATWKVDLEQHPAEAAMLTLDSSRAKQELMWSERLSSVDAIEWTVDWYLARQSGEAPRELMARDISRFEQIPLKRQAPGAQKYD